MYQTLELFPGVTLRYLHSSRFKQGVLSIQFLRPMTKQEAALNALIPEILLRGCQSSPDLREITARLDDLYGASVASQVRRVGDYQTTGLACGFMEDRFALPGDEILAPMVAFLQELLLQPLTERGGFCGEFVESEKRNLISALESQRSDKAAYATGKLLKNMCRGDSFGLPRMGEIAQVKKITPRSAYAHYQKVLQESPVEIFYVGAAPIQQVSALVKPIFEKIPRCLQPLPPQTGFSGGKSSHKTETMDIAQGKLSMGFVTSITNGDDRFAAMQVCNLIFGGGMTSKLFMQVREKESLCYAIASGYYGSKGIVLVDAGIDSRHRRRATASILRQLEACQQGQITQQELHSAKEALLSALRSVYDSPGGMERYFSAAAISGVCRSPERYAEEIRAVELPQVVEAACSLQLHSSFFLRGASHE